MPPGRHDAIAACRDAAYCHAFHYFRLTPMPPANIFIISPPYSAARQPLRYAATLIRRCYAAIAEMPADAAMIIYVTDAATLMRMLRYATPALMPLTLPRHYYEAADTLMMRRYAAIEAMSRHALRRY